MTPVVQYASLLIRLWHPEKADDLSTCRIEVEHIQTGKSWVFHSLNEMTDFFGQNCTAELTWIDIQAAEFNDLNVKIEDA